MKADFTAPLSLIRISFEYPSASNAELTSSEFEQWLDGFNTTQKEDRLYWHVIIYRKGDNYTLQRKKGEKAVELTKYLMPEKTT
jgi:hypothetical protein